MGGEDVFYGKTYGFEHGDFAIVFALREFAEFGGDVGLGPEAFGDSHDDIASFFESGGAGVDDEAGPQHEGGIEFAVRRDAGSDGDDMSAVCDPFALNYWGGRCGGCEIRRGIFGIRWISSSSSTVRCLLNLG